MLYTIIIIIVLVIAIQTYFGYIQNKLLGSILPIAVIVLGLYLLFTGNLTFSIRDILMPFVGLFAMIGLWISGSERKEKKLNDEMNKMKSKDKLAHERD